MSNSTVGGNGRQGSTLRLLLAHPARSLTLALCGGLLLFAATGCQTSGGGVQAQPLSPAQEQRFASLGQDASQTAAGAPAKTTPTGDTLLLREGDLVRITFPGAPNLNPGTLQIQRDGKLNLPLKGEITAAGLSIADLQKKLLEIYSPDLQVKEVTVALESSAFTIYVTGAVQRSGKILSDHPINVLEAIMEAGGVDFAKANLKAIKVIRRGDNGPKYFELNMKRAFRDGRDVEPFNLKPFDIIYVPERFSWF
jgi:polysaccharide biosynthesis/export protein